MVRGFEVVHVMWGGGVWRWVGDLEVWCVFTASMARCECVWKTFAKIKEVGIGSWVVGGGGGEGVPGWWWGVMGDRGRYGSG